MLNRRYSDAIIAESFEKAEKKEWKSLYNTKCDTNKSHNWCFPLACDYNPGLPNIGGILSKHKHILDLDDDLKDVINKDNIFASCRGNKTIKDILTHSKLRSGHVDTQEDQRSVPNGECKKCKKCNKQCYVCKNYLIEGTEIDSYYTNTIQFTGYFQLQYQMRRIHDQGQHMQGQLQKMHRPFSESSVL